MSSEGHRSHVGAECIKVRVPPLYLAEAAAAREAVADTNRVDGLLACCHHVRRDARLHALELAKLWHVRAL
eukprot:4848898-Prymnesium_polylepis.1